MGQMIQVFFKCHAKQRLNNTTVISIKYQNYTMEMQFLEMCLRGITKSLFLSMNRGEEGFSIYINICLFGTTTVYTRNNNFFQGS